MVETREQFRDRLSEIGFRPGEDFNGEWLGVKEAVYAQALRDVRTRILHDTISTCAGWFPQDVTKFAESKGIDLTGVR